MENGLHEWPLVLFTVLAQSVVGAFIALTLVLLTAEGKRFANRIHYGMAVLWVLMACGFMFSTMHLGSPERAFNALNRIGQSDLSNEIATGSLFFALGSGYWALAVSRFVQKDRPNLPLVGLVASIEQKLPARWGDLARIVVALSGLVFVAAMAKLYMIPTVPTWNSIYTPLSFGLTVLISGSLLAAVILNFTQTHKAFQTGLVVVAFFGLLVAIVISWLQYQFLAQVSTSIFQALERVPDFVWLMSIRFVMSLVGISLVFFALRKAQNPMAILGFLLVFAGELIARTLFYGLHMTVGLKALGA
ncbi:hypothetical protein A1D29_07125 [Pasteurellaceae bacterium Orientalotternb1]|nr:hypothetical protein A1D29_07125 [Pasteurellaceae bacterium Orientalotternb1]